MALIEAEEGGGEARGGTARRLVDIVMKKVSGVVCMYDEEYGGSHDE